MSQDSTESFRNSKNRSSIKAERDQSNCAKNVSCRFRFLAYLEDHVFATQLCCQKFS